MRKIFSAILERLKRAAGTLIRVLVPAKYRERGRQIIADPALRRQLLRRICRLRLQRDLAWAGVRSSGHGSPLSVIGVTIGCYENWSAAAQKAGERFTRSTGIPCRIIDESFFARVAPHRILGESPEARASSLKLHVFDFFKEHETIIYFDSDIAFLRPWDVAPYLDQKDFMCVKDRWHTPILQDICRQSKLDPLKYVNAGFFIANRKYHRTVLDYVCKIYPLVPQLFWEQTALNFALQDLNVPTRFLDQGHNCMYYEVYPGSIFERCELTALHGFKPRMDETTQRMWDRIFAQAGEKKEFYYDRRKMADRSGTYILRQDPAHVSTELELYEDGTTNHEDCGWLLVSDSDRIAFYDRDKGRHLGSFEPRDGRALVLSSPAPGTAGIFNLNPERLHI